jgi:large conductance mechanosensitive channel
MLKGFKEFIMKGNVLDLAVAVVIGAAFTAVIAAVVDGFINPLIAAIFGKPNLDSVGNFTINGAEFSIGVILTAVINFLIVAAAVYFVLILPMQKLMERRKRGEEPAPSEPTDVELLKEIRDLLAARNDA